ncbi:amino acid ABC transporter permease [Siculibacillus lacustris]|uniref:Amino acid ABC transporter permease n=1 Tax=Siculibacillus lacustris TaxID=1549641 RepID=A0A4Q9W065_9HYPH|nr:amino acid ABC transporter permease [Siculibacillus lacustris]TBW41363.1 amino acid ABC transporter permease [Siculibacillus lacustris]
MSYQFDFSFLADYWPLLFWGTVATIRMSVIVTCSGFVFGTLCAVASTSRIAVLRNLVAVYVEAIRNTPLLVQLFLVYFGLSSLGLRFSAETSALIGLTINVGAYSSEIIRAGLEAIHRGQIEAADTLGFSRLQVLAGVMLPPAFEKVYPALVSQYVLLMLGTSITSQISAEELTGAASRIQSMTFRSFEVYLVILGVYLVLSFGMRGLLRLLGLVLFPRLRRLGTNL